eukprot:365930-Chlamydomonas_euryale.AAC.35
MAVVVSMNASRRSPRSTACSAVQHTAGLTETGNGGRRCRLLGGNGRFHAETGRPFPCGSQSVVAYAQTDMRCMRPLTPTFAARLLLPTPRQTCAAHALPTPPRHSAQTHTFASRPSSPPLR